jgi:hypothetical protein
MTALPRVGLREGLMVALMAGLMVGLMFGLIFGVIGALREGLIFWLVFELRDALGQALIVGLTVGLIVGLVKIISSEAIAETRATPNEGTWRSLKMAMIFGLSVGLMAGGLFAVKHVILRLGLRQSRSAPLQYVAFLEEAKELLFLRQVGGGYIFAHRLLREYFESLRAVPERGVPNFAPTPGSEALL